MLPARDSGEPARAGPGDFPLACGYYARAGLARRLTIVREPRRLPAVLSVEEVNSVDVGALRALFDAARYFGRPSRRSASPIGSQISARPVWARTKPETVNPGSSSSPR